MLELHSRIGFELELMAPVGRSRLDLAQAIAQHYQGSVRSYFHPQEEPSQVRGQPIFVNVTPGFRVEDAAGNWWGSCVDDLTLQRDFDRQAKPVGDWYRVVTDDHRLLELVMGHCDPRQPLSQVLVPLAELFGTMPQSLPHGMVQVLDRLGNSVAIAAPLPGERERPCEWITPPLSRDHGIYLQNILQTAQSLNFGIPQEAALHLHFDARPLCQASTFQRIVTLLHRYNLELRTLVGTNPHCRRLVPWEQLENSPLAIALDPDFADLPWAIATTLLKKTNLTKYCDFNLKNWVYGLPEKFTLEIRILPMSLQTEKIIEMAKLFDTIITFAQTSIPIPENLDLKSFLEKIN